MHSKPEITMFAQETAHRLEQLETAIAAPTVKVVSFDIFDTLICRPVLRPTDVFDVVEAICRNKLNRPQFLFKKMRIKSEQLARKLEGGEEVTLAEIYAHMQRYFYLDDDVVVLAKQTELDVELKLARARKIGKLLFEYALQEGKEVVLVSDMYLPEAFIRKLLKKCGYVGYTKLYISSSLGITKKTGQLYNHILAEKKIYPKEMVHFGDHKRNDVDMARSQNISAFHIPKAVDVFWDHKENCGVWGRLLDELEPGCRLTLGLIVNNVYDTDVFDNTLCASCFAGSTYIFGYYCVGLFALSLTRWIISESIKDGFSNIFFVARDGKIPLQVFNKIIKYYSNKVKGSYLYASRSLCYPLMICDKEDIVFNRERLYVHPSSSMRDLLEVRLGVPVDNSIAMYLSDKGYTDLDLPPEDIDRFFSVCSEFSDQILESFKRKQEDILAYFRDQIRSVPDSVLFDIGYRARLQKVLSDHFGEAVNAYYVMSFSDVYNVYFSNAVVKNYVFPPCSRSWITKDYYTAIFELILSDVDNGSILDIKRENGQFEFVFEEQYINDIGIKKVHEIQRGCMDFVDDFVEMFGDYFEYINVFPKSSLRPLEAFMRNPTKLDAQILRDIEFSNGIIGDTFSFINESGGSYWAPGAHALSLASKGHDAAAAGYKKIRKHFSNKIRTLLSH